MSTQGPSSNAHPSHTSIHSGQSLNLAKTLQVQDQIIERLRKDQADLRELLEVERNSLKECRLNADRELKALQREKIQVNKINRQQEVKIEELEKELTFAKETLAFEEKNLKTLEKEHMATVKDLKLKISKEFDKANKQEVLIDQLKSDVENLKEALQSERNATNMLIREHSAEVKMLREEVKNKSTEAYRELKERATREREEYREIQEEAEKTYGVLEKDFREALAAKDEELRKVKAESKLIQKELEDQLRASLKEPTPTTCLTTIPAGYVEIGKFKRLKNEVNVLKEQNRKLLNELQALTEEGKTNEVSSFDDYMIPDYHPHKKGINEIPSKQGDQENKSMLYISQKHPEVEITRLSSENSINRTSNKRQTRSSLSMKREDNFKPHSKSKTEERYEELKRTMQILRKALQ